MVGRICARDLVGRSLTASIDSFCITFRMWGHRITIG